MLREIDRLGHDASPFLASLLQQIADVVTAMHRFEEGLVPRRRPGLAAGRAGAEAIALLVVAFQRDDRRVSAERADDAVEAVKQVGPPNAPAHGGAEHAEHVRAVPLL